MGRVMIALCVVLVILAGVAGALSQPGDKSRFKSFLADVAGRRHPQTAQDTPRITSQTQVLFDGSPRRYEDVPPDAVIVHLEVGPDQRTVQRICFETRK